MTSLTKDRLDKVVETLKVTLSKDEMRKISVRSVQAKIWHREPIVSEYMSELRAEEESVRTRAMALMSNLIYKFHEHVLELTDLEPKASTTTDEDERLDVFCLDSKERIYLILKRYGWLGDFFRYNPQHFYENSFGFVDRIPNKEMPVKVKVIGLGIGGSLAVSGLAKNGIEVIGYEKRDREGPRRASLRYQNTSWRGYEVAEKLLDGDGFDRLMLSRQKLNVMNDDGSFKTVTSDRTQVILGEAIDIAVASAERYGADLRFGCDNSAYYGDDGGIEDSDIVAIFAGAHTVSAFPLLKGSLDIMEWPECKSSCLMWLRVKESEHKEAFTSRGGEVGAENWHYSIFSSRNSLDDIERVRDNVDNQLRYSLAKLPKDHPTIPVIKEESALKKKKVEDLIDKLVKHNVRYDYIFTNAPLCDHNQKKKDIQELDGSVILEGSYTVEVKLASNATTNSNMEDPATKLILNKLATKLVLTGGDACVPPNPYAAYGATLACMFSDMIVNLSVAQGHINAILQGMEFMLQKGLLVDEGWMPMLVELKAILVEYYDARARSENYFQFVQTTICNLYSLPPFY